jgi:hypothetical protein
VRSGFALVNKEQNAQVSDTTGDAMKYFSLLHNNSSLTAAFLPKKYFSKTL